MEAFSGLQLGSDIFSYENVGSNEALRVILWTVVEMHACYVQNLLGWFIQDKKNIDGDNEITIFDCTMIILYGSDLKLF